MLITVKHELNLLDAADGYICEALMIELEKVKEKDVTIEIDVDYSAGRPAKIDGPWEDCYPEDPEEYEAEKDADDYAWEIIQNLCVSLNGLPVMVALSHADEIKYNLRQGLTVDIQNFIDNDLKEAVNSDLEVRNDEA